MFDRVQARLSLELETLDVWLRRDDLSAKDHVALARAASQRRWALSSAIPSTPGGVLPHLIRPKLRLLQSRSVGVAC